MVEKTYVALNFLRFLPHLLVFAFAGNKKVITDDVSAYKNEYGLKGGRLYLLVHFLLVLNMEINKFHIMGIFF